MDGLNLDQTTRRGFGVLGMGALLGTLGGVMLGGAQPAEARPSDVKGSPNVPLRVFQNQNGKFILWSDGSFSNPKNNSPRIMPNYSNAPGYPPPQPVPGRTQGSPHVAVDIIQDENGTYVLFADGTVRKPDNVGVNTPPYANVKYYSWFIQQIGGSGETMTPGLTRNGRTYTFDHPFIEVPLVYGVLTAGSDSTYYITGHYGMSVTKSGFTAPDFSGRNWGGLVVGKY